MEQNKKELLLGQIGTIASWRWRRRTSQPYVDERHLRLGAGKGEHSRILFRKDGVELAELVYNPKNADKEKDNVGMKGLVVPTVQQKPDIVLQLTKNDLQHGMKMTYLFDAKYRIDGR